MHNLFCGDLSKLHSIMHWFMNGKFIYFQKGKKNKWWYMVDKHTSEDAVKISEVKEPYPENILKEY